MSEEILNNLGKIDPPNMPGIFDYIDVSVADDLGVDVEIYKDIIENHCTYSESKFIIFAVFSGRPDKIQKAKDLVNSKIKK